MGKRKEVSSEQRLPRDTIERMEDDGDEVRDYIGLSSLSESMSS